MCTDKGIRHSHRDVTLGEDENLTVHLHEFRAGIETSGGGERRDGAGQPLLVMCIHGAGYSGLTFAPFAEALFVKLSEEGAGDSNLVVVAPDLRSHGRTTARDESNLSIDTLVDDIEQVYAADLSRRFGDVVLIGWSMGAAVAIKVASLAGGLLASRLVGLVAIDVVEGTALEALKSMSMILAARPKGFDSIEEAVEWAVTSGTTRRRASAEISVPGMLVERTQSECIEECMGRSTDVEPSRGGHGRDRAAPRRMGPPMPRYPREGAVSRGRSPGSTSLDAIVEDGSIGSAHSGDGVKKSTLNVGDGVGQSAYKYGWRVALEKTEPYWSGWFIGLSQAFLNVRVPKMLLLAGHDRLDKTLMIAQMQGKFQMAVVPHAGHAIHEDQPEAVADKILAFLRRYELFT